QCARLRFYFSGRCRDRDARTRVTTIRRQTNNRLTAGVSGQTIDRFRVRRDRRLEFGGTFVRIQTFTDAHDDGGEIVFRAAFVTALLEYLAKLIEIVVEHQQLPQFV